MVQIATRKVPVSINVSSTHGWPALQRSMPFGTTKLAWRAHYHLSDSPSNAHLKPEVNLAAEQLSPCGAVFAFVRGQQRTPREETYDVRHSSRPGMLDQGTTALSIKHVELMGPLFLT
jgi:hypothetical protein